MGNMNNADTIYLMGLTYLLLQLRLMYKDKNKKVSRSSLLSQLMLISIPIAGIFMFYMRVYSTLIHIAMMCCLGGIAIFISKSKI